MRRKFFAFASALSLLLFAATAGLLVGSCSRGGRMFRISGHGFARPDGTRTEYVAECYAGRVGVGAVRVLKPPPPPVSPAWVKSRRVFIWRRLGFDLMMGENVSYGARKFNSPPYSVVYDAETYYIGCPSWLVIAVALPLPALWVHHQLRMRRVLRLAGCCKQCGYDLRATPDRCPECGTPSAPLMPP